MPGLLHPTHWSARLAAPLIAALLAGCAGAQSSQQPALSALQPGALLSATRLVQHTELPHASERWLITYRSRGVHAEPIVASGEVLLPAAAAPASGWPMLVWAHGTTGVADTCAPSASHAGGPVDDYQQAVRPLLDDWLARGHAVVAPDYQGLGTPGEHPYMNAASQWHAVADAARALQRLRPQSLGSDWWVMGHSQGGAAALAAAQHAPRDLPQLRLRGAIALAPGGYRYADIAHYAQTQPRLTPAVAAFFPIVLLGAQAAEPTLAVEALVDAGMRTLLQRARSRCLSELTHEITQAPAPVFAPGADLVPLLDYLGRQALEHLVPATAVLFVQGSADALVDPEGTRTLYRRLCQSGHAVHWHEIAAGSHRDALSQSGGAIAAFLAAPEATGCADAAGAAKADKTAPPARTPGAR